MAVSWTAHRFSGGALALDTANTVVLRHNAARTFDRFDDVSEIARFAEAASGYRADELGNRHLEAGDTGLAGRLIGLREATDRLFREAAANEALDGESLHGFVSACATGLASTKGVLAAPGRPFGDPATPIALDAAVAVSALALLRAARDRRIRICANCGWLFLDASRNRSRLWCDMTVCGNRAKAKRHYRRRREEERSVGDA